MSIYRGFDIEQEREGLFAIYDKDKALRGTAATEEKAQDAVDAIKRQEFVDKAKGGAA
jgi:hypothetical protein